MNWKQITILIIAIAVSALIVWHDLPIEFPGMIVKALVLFVKLFIVLALAIFASIFASGKKSHHDGCNCSLKAAPQKKSPPP